MDEGRRTLLRTSLGVAATGLMNAALPVAAMADTPSGDKVTITRLSWAGVKLVYRKTTIFVDPWISTGIWDGAWKEPVIPVTAETDRRHVLLTHLHNDHFDPPAIKAVAAERGFSVVVSDQRAASIASRGLRTTAAPMHEPVLLGDFTVVPVPASDGFAEFQVHWLIFTDRHRFIHCGDSLWHGGFWKIARQYGPLDAAFLPINGARLTGVQPFSDVEASMTPQHAIAAARVLGARLAVPIHYGLHDEGVYMEHPNAVQEFRAFAEKRSQPYRVLRPGEVFEVG